MICTLNPYFYPSLAEVQAYEQVAGAEPLSGPATMTGWLHDVIAEKAPIHEHTNGGLDDEDYVLFSTGLQEDGAIADDSGVVTTSKGTVFQLAPYDANNALVLKNVNEEQTLTFEQPGEFEEIQILTISANGQSTLNVYANYEDGSKSETWTFNPDDWYSETAGGDEAVYGLGRARVVEELDWSTWDYVKKDKIDSRYNFRLYEFAFRPDVSKTVKSLTFSSGKSRSYPTVFAVSKTGKSVGIKDVYAPNTYRTIIGIYNLQGVPVQNPGTGIYIIRYSDGTAGKVLIK